jgi:tRNA 2-thiouridine synthesizing protein A
MAADQTETVPHDRELDARGLECPLPILRTKKLLNQMAAAQVLRVVATDPGSVRDFEAFCRQSGHHLLESTRSGAEFVFVLRKKS